MALLATIILTVGQTVTVGIHYTCSGANCATQWPTDNCVIAAITLAALQAITQWPRDNRVTAAITIAAGRAG